ncbi:MAG: hypothetical protein PHI35_06420 [Victivallaceae bacterium]|nr:hypothetical protein [Victivallaceae bacterium]
MSRAKRQPGSSLELLLDTMCNTFGGVMFIAIALAVVAAASSEQMAKPSAGSDTADRKLTRLAEQIKLYKYTAAPALPSSSGDKAELERLTHLAQEAETELATRRDAAARLADIEHKTRSAKTRLASLNAEAAALAVKSRQLRDETEKLHRSRVSIALPALAESELMPYFILLNAGEAWRVGPEVGATGFTPCADVISSGQPGRMTCRPRPGSGVRVLAGGKFAPEFESLLAGLPGNRAPKFVIPASEAELFATVRNELKRRKKIHGFIMLPHDAEFTYTVGANARYEY